MFKVNIEGHSNDASDIVLESLLSTYNLFHFFCSIYIVDF